MRKSSMTKEKGRRRGNKAVWPYMYSCLIQTKKISKKYNQCNQYKQPTVNSNTVTAGGLVNTVRRGFSCNSSGGSLIVSCPLR